MATGICHSICHLIYPPNWKAREELDAVEGSAVCFADLGQLSCLKKKTFLFILCGDNGLMGHVRSRVESIVLRKLSPDVIAVFFFFFFGTTIQPRSHVFSRPHTRLFDVCCCLSATPFPDVWLLDHVSINVNVFWFVKHM